MSASRTSPAEVHESESTPVADRNRIELAEHPSVIYVLLKWAGFAGLIMLSVVAGALVCRELGIIPRTSSASASPVLKVEDVPTNTEADKKSIEDATAAGTHRAQLMLAKVKQRQALDRVKAAGQALDEAVKGITRFEARVTQVLEGDDGKAVVANRALVSQVAAVLDMKRPALAEVERMRTMFRDLTGPLEASATNGRDASLPPEDVMNEVAVCADRAKKALDAYQDVSEKLEAIVSAAAGSSGASGSTSLAQALADQRREEVRTETERVEAARAKALEASAAQLAVVEAEKTRLLGEKEVEARKAELRAELARKDLDRKKALAADPAIQAKFRPLLAKGRWLLAPYSFSKISAPASYSILVKQGYLTGFEPFARAMAGWANVREGYSPGDGYYTGFSDRPKHPMPTTEAGWIEMKEMFEMFKELAPIWVESGLLSK